MGTEENLANAGSLKMSLIVLTLRYRKKDFLASLKKLKNFEKVFYSSIFFHMHVALTIDPFRKRHKLVFNGKFQKFEVLFAAKILLIKPIKIL